jgi:hypothetical protein
MDSGVIYRRAIPFSYSLAFILSFKEFLPFSPDVYLKFSVALYSFITLVFFYKILMLLKIKKEDSLLILFLFSISTWILTYS